MTCDQPEGTRDWPLTKYFSYMYSLCSVCLCGEGNACQHVCSRSSFYQVGSAIRPAQLSPPELFKGALPPRAVVHACHLH